MSAYWLVELCLLSCNQVPSDACVPGFTGLTDAAEESVQDLQYSIQYRHPPAIRAGIWSASAAGAVPSSSSTPPTPPEPEQALKIESMMDRMQRCRQGNDTLRSIFRLHANNPTAALRFRDLYRLDFPAPVGLDVVFQVF
jgi:hypothetical protein